MGSLGNQYTNPHGMSKTKFYNVWMSMRRRCTDDTVNGYERYSKVKVCSRWDVFNNFRDDMLKSYQNHVSMFGEKDTTLERNDVYGDYEPGNCRWATKLEQQNNKTTNLFFEYRGEVLSLADLCRKYSINYWAAQKRVESGWDIGRVMETPVRKMSKYLDESGQRELAISIAKDVIDHYMTTDELIKKYQVSATKIHHLTKVLLPVMDQDLYQEFTKIKRLIRKYRNKMHSDIDKEVLL